MHGKRWIFSIVCMMGATLLSAEAFSQDRLMEKPKKEHPHREMGIWDVAPAAKVSLSQAIANALSAQPGSAVKAELEGEESGQEVSVAFEVMILTKDLKVFTVKLDPAEGKVSAVEEEKDPEDIEEALQARWILRAARLGLADLAARAEGIFTQAKAVEAELEGEDGEPACAVKVLRGNSLIEATVEVRAGDLVGLELESGRPEKEGRRFMKEEKEGHEKWMEKKSEGDEEDHERIRKVWEEDEENGEEEGEEESFDRDED